MHCATKCISPTHSSYNSCTTLLETNPVTAHSASIHVTPAMAAVHSTMTGGGNHVGDGACYWRQAAFSWKTRSCDVNTHYPYPSSQCISWRPEIKTQQHKHNSTKSVQDYTVVRSPQRGTCTTPLPADDGIICYLSPPV